MALCVFKKNGAEILGLSFYILLCPKYTFYKHYYIKRKSIIELYLLDCFRLHMCKKLSSHTRAYILHTIQPTNSFQIKLKYFWIATKPKFIFSLITVNLNFYVSDRRTIFSVFPPPSLNLRHLVTFQNACFVLPPCILNGSGIWTAGRPVMQTHRVTPNCCCADRHRSPQKSCSLDGNICL